MDTTWRRGRGFNGAILAFTGAVALCLLALPGGAAQIQGRIWPDELGGLWTNDGSWEPAGSPDNTSEVGYEVALSGGNPLDPGAAIVINSFIDVNTLAVGGGRPLLLQPGATLGIATNGLANDGVIRLLPGDGAATLSVQPSTDELNIQGVGRIELNGPGARIVGAGGPTIVNALTHSITGYGQVGANDIGLTNTGRIEADVLGQRLTIDPATSLEVLNDGRLFATNGGILRLGDGLYRQEAVGQIRAFDGSLVELANDAEVAGGVLSTEGSGQIWVIGDATLRSQPGVPLRINEGTPVTIVNTVDPFVQGQIANDGQITQAGLTSTTLVQLTGDTALSGTGAWALADSPDGVNQIGGTAGFTLINGVDHTIRGAGRLGTATLAIDNAGTIHADGLNVLELFPGTGLTVSNSGLLHTQGLGGIELRRGGYTNTGEIRVGAGSELRLKNQAVLQNEPEGVITGEGTIVIENGGVLNNLGTIAPGSSPGTLTIDGDVAVGKLAIEIASLEPGAFDVLNVLGQATLTGGTLDVSFVGGPFFIPVDTQFKVLSATSVTGVLAALKLPLDENNQPLFSLDDSLPGELTLTATRDFQVVPEQVVPEPAGWVVLAGLALGAVRRKRGSGTA